MKLQQVLTLDEMAYPGNIGAMEMMMFHRKASADEKSQMKKLLTAKKFKDAWEFLQKVTGVKLAPLKEQATPPQSNWDAAILSESTKFTTVNGDSVHLEDKTFVQHGVDKRIGLKLVLIESKLLEQMWIRGGMAHVVGPAPDYKNQIKNRIQQFKDFLETHDTIRVGDAAIDKNGALQFGDGRHRTRVLLELGYTQIPVSLSNESIENLKKQ